jgi:flagellar L-ring protein precursor FlgH
MNKASWLISKGLFLVLVTSAPLAPADSLWQKGQSRSIVADKRAFAVGDLLSIAVQETSTATKDNTTKTARQSSVDASISSFLYSPSASGLLTKGGKLPAMSFSGKQNFEGSGKINNSEQIIARIAVQVIDVLPNMNLVVEGRRLTSFSGETQEIILRGVVRPPDITANNTVFSYNVADATIRFISKGTVTDNQRKGWFMRIWEKVSPF